MKICKLVPFVICISVPIGIALYPASNSVFLYILFINLFGSFLVFGGTFPIA